MAGRIFLLVFPTSCWPDRHLSKLVLQYPNPLLCWRVSLKSTYLSQHRAKQDRVALRKFGTKFVQNLLRGRLSNSCTLQRDEIPHLNEQIIALVPRTSCVGVFADYQVVSRPHFGEQLTWVDWFRTFGGCTAHAHLIATKVRLGFCAWRGLWINSSNEHSLSKYFIALLITWPYRT